MNNLSIEVSSIANLVDNPDFSRWNQNYPTSWDVYELIDGGVVVNYPFEGGFACGIVDVESATESYLTQEIGILTSGDNYTLSINHWGGGYVKLQYENPAGTWNDVSGGMLGGNASDWRDREINVVISATKPHRIHIKADYDDFDYFYVNIVNCYKSTWYEDRLPLNIEEITKIENLSNEIEDDIFTFISDSLELEVYNYESEMGFYTPADFLTNSQRIFRFDIKFEYNENVTKEIIMFSNNDTVTRSQRPGSDIIKLSLYELPTLFNDNGWFLGKLTEPEYDDDGDAIEEANWKYESHLADSNSYNSNVPIATVVSELTNDTLNLMKQRAIPVRDSDFSISNNLSAESALIKIYYNDVIGSGTGEYYVIDAVITPTQRVFLLLLRKELINAELSDNDIKIWELVNGTTLTETNLGVPVMNGTDDAILGDGYSVAFIHTYSGATNFAYSPDSDIDGKEIEFALMRQHYDSTSGMLRVTKAWAYTNNDSSGEDSEFDLVRAGRLLYARNDSSDYAQLRKCMYVNSLGALIQLIGDLTYDTNTDNMLWIGLHSYESTTLSANYTFSDTVEAGSNIWNYYYARSMVTTIPRFPQFYSFKFENATPATVLKELAITQDAIWYLSYSDSNMTANIYSRDDTSAPDDYWDDNDWLIKEQYVKMIKFDDLQSQMFNNDFERMRDMVGYYNNKYGRGRTEIDAREWGYHNFSLRDIVRYNNKTYFIKQVELENYDYATNFRIFEIWQ